jgi:hypothetical protein
LSIPSAKHVPNIFTEQKTPMCSLSMLRSYCPKAFFSSM